MKNRAALPNRVRCVLALRWLGTGFLKNGYLLKYDIYFKKWIRIFGKLPV